LNKNSVITDIGSGTGKLTEIFLKNKNTVYGIEPNSAMRKGGEKVLKKYKNFISLNGSAENTGLPANSVDIIAAGQAFHWFRIKETKIEFRRILKKEGYAVLIWNDRVTDNPKKKSFLGEYETLLIKFGTDFKKVRKNNIDNKTFNKFFKNKYNLKKFYNYQIFDFKGLKGRLLSSSYIPTERGKLYNDMIEELKKLYFKYQNKGKVKFDYICEVYSGKI
jgi:ubiquinone/menaquinone biosynthesis C-methylase UbiE